MGKLAVLGGEPTIKNKLSLFNAIGPGEMAAAQRVMESGCLSQFLGVWGDDFLGGPEVRSLEQEWAHRFGSIHAVSVNSATSGLFAAVGAVGISPGDEVIVPPWTMSATAMAPLIYGGIPVFADIEPDSFCINPTIVEKLLSDRTKAIIAVNLFGHPARLSELRQLADRHGLKLIEDNAQAPLASEFGRYAGTIGHIGVFSLNYHKHVHCGEGGICVTDDDDLALRLQLIRNHGENAVAPAGVAEIGNLVGFNYRLTEIAAAIARVQLYRADDLVNRWKRIADILARKLGGIKGFTLPVARDGCTHVYYGWFVRLDEAELGVGRKEFASALRAEGIPVSEGYVDPLYRLPVFQNRKAFGDHGYPFNLSSRTYNDALCPVAEKLHQETALGIPLPAYNLGESEVERCAEAILKVYEHRFEIPDSAESVVWRNVGAKA